MSDQQLVEKQDKESELKLSNRPSRSDAVKRRVRKSSKETPVLERQNQNEAPSHLSLAVIRQNRETIVKHLSRALNMDDLDLELESSDATQVSGMKIPRVGSQSEGTRGLGEILSELDSLLKSNVFSKEDLLLAIESRWNIKVRNLGDSSQSGREFHNEVTRSTMIQSSHEAGTSSQHHKRDARKGETVAESSEVVDAPHYTNGNFQPSLEGLTMVTYTPPYENQRLGSQSNESASNSQSSDQSSTNDQESTPYENLNTWVDSGSNSKALKSESNTRVQTKSKPLNTNIPIASTKTTATPPQEQEGSSSVKQKSARKIPPKPPIRMRSQSSIDVSPKSRRKKLVNPAVIDERESPSHGYQLALQMEDERLFNHRVRQTEATNDVSLKQSTSTSSSGQPSLGQSPTSGQRSTSGQAPSDSTLTISDAKSSKNDNTLSQPPKSSPASSSSSPGSSPELDPRQSRLPQPRARIGDQTGSGSSTAGLQRNAGVRDSRSYSAGSKQLHRVNAKRRPSAVTMNEVAGTQTTFMNGIGVFTQRGGILTNAGSGVVIEIPEDAIPRGKSKKSGSMFFRTCIIQFMMKEWNHQVRSQTFQFQTGSAEFENYLAGERAQSPTQSHDSDRSM